jgi:hypothetical protein
LPGGGCPGRVAIEFRYFRSAIYERQLISWQNVFEQVLKRNREPHSGTRWSKGTENKRSTSTTAMATAAGSSTHTVDEVASYKRQLEQLHEENQALKEALEEVNGFL